MSEAHGPLPYATPPPRRRRLVLWIVGVSMLVGVLLALVALIFLDVEARYEARGFLEIRPVDGSIRLLEPVVPPSTPAQITLVQRTQQPLPGSNGTVLIHIGDITRGQTLATIADINGQTLLSASMREGDAQTFRAGAIPYEIELVELRNVLVGDDTAVFELRPPTTAPAAER